MTKLYTQVHCLRDGQVLLMQRHKEPNLGLWVAPGGKIEALADERMNHLTRVRCGSYTKRQD